MKTLMFALLCSSYALAGDGTLPMLETSTPSPEPSVAATPEPRPSPEAKKVEKKKHHKGKKK